MYAPAPISSRKKKCTQQNKNEKGDKLFGATAFDAAPKKTRMKFFQKVGPEIFHCYNRRFVLCTKQYVTITYFLMFSFSPFSFAALLVSGIE